MAAEGMFNEPGELTGLTAHDIDGDKIGSVGQVYSDDRTGRPEWVTVKTGLFGMKESFVPLKGARRDGDSLVVPYAKDMVKDAPRLDADEHLDAGQERELYQHYGLTSGAPAAGGMAAGDRTTGGMAAGGLGMRGDAVADTRRAEGEGLVRSEEELHVGVEDQEVGRARLRKVVVTENVTKTVPVSHEEVRVVHEPITAADRAARGARIQEDETEVILHAERPVVRKETVGVERVRLETDKVTEQREVSEDVRKEEIQYDTDEGMGKEGRGGKRGPGH
ncbi:MAG TPA: PRC and DUF2382 domain-containing protein [Streptomyces sp.]|nr:PRC and DUF2382 domain-containing protein [Streptomyces sp.]